MKHCRRSIAFFVVLTFVVTTIAPYKNAYSAQTGFGLPVPGTMVNLSAAYAPLLIKGLRVHPENPLLFDFIVDTGNSPLKKDSTDLRAQTEKLIKYFLATLTIPEKDLWVNLSPYEKDRIIEQSLGETELGAQMLAQDYILKQLTASLIYPEKELGKKFWDKVYAQTRERFGANTNIPVNTFNKVWILPDQADIFVRNNTAFVVKGHLKVMLEQDYLASQKHMTAETPSASNSSASQVIREIVLPEIEKEVNQGENFAPLRQIFNSIVLASWYKKNLKEALLNQVYTDKGKISALGGSGSPEEIYKRYLQAYKKGVFNYIKESKAPNGQMTPRKYFSGGLVWAQTPAGNPHVVNSAEGFHQDGAMLSVAARIEKPSDAAMNTVSTITAANAVKLLLKAGRNAASEKDLLDWYVQRKSQEMGLTDAGAADMLNVFGVNVSAEDVRRLLNQAQGYSSDRIPATANAAMISEELRAAAVAGAAGRTIFNASYKRVLPKLTMSAQIILNQLQDKDAQRFVKLINFLAVANYESIDIQQDVTLEELQAWVDQNTSLSLTSPRPVSTKSLTISKPPAQWSDVHEVLAGIPSIDVSNIASIDAALKLQIPAPYRAEFYNPQGDQFIVIKPYGLTASLNSPLSNAIVVKRAIDGSVKVSLREFSRLQTALDAVKEVVKQDAAMSTDFAAEAARFSDYYANLKIHNFEETTLTKSVIDQLRAEYPHFFVELMKHLKLNEQIKGIYIAPEIKIDRLIGWMQNKFYGVGVNAYLQYGETFNIEMVAGYEDPVFFSGMVNSYRTVLSLRVPKLMEHLEKLTEKERNDLLEKIAKFPLVSLKYLDESDLKGFSEVVTPIYKRLFLVPAAKPDAKRDAAMTGNANAGLKKILDGMIEETITLANALPAEHPLNGALLQLLNALTSSTDTTEQKGAYLQNFQEQLDAVSSAAGIYAGRMEDAALGLSVRVIKPVREGTGTVDGLLVIQEKGQLLRYEHVNLNPSTTALQEAANFLSIQRQIKDELESKRVAEEVRKKIESMKEHIRDLQDRIHTALQALNPGVTDKRSLVFTSWNASYLAAIAPTVAFDEQVKTLRVIKRSLEELAKDVSPKSITLPLAKTRSAKFGTSGDRGIIDWDQDGKGDFDIDLVRRDTQGIAEYALDASRNRTFVVGYDTRKNNPEYAREAASILAANGFKVIFVAQEATPTPILAVLATNRNDVAGVINFTASHSPYTDGGLKFSPSHGGAADTAATDKIERLANQAGAYKVARYADAVKDGRIIELAPERAVEQYVDGYLVPALKDAKDQKGISAWDDIVRYVRDNKDFNVVVDPLQGTGVKAAQVLFAKIAQEAGRDFYKVIHTDNKDPKFTQTGGAPQPAGKYIQGLLTEVKAAPNTLGLAVDGDVDRFGVVDFGGKEITANEMIGLLAWFLKKDVGLDGALVKTVATSNFANAVAEHLGMELIETPVGFKYSVEQVLAGKKVLVAGEESAHAAVGPFMRSWDDGFATSLAALWMVAKTGKSVAAYKNEIEQQIGKTFESKVFTMRDAEGKAKANVIALIKAAKEEMAAVAATQIALAKKAAERTGTAVSDVNTMDGIKLVFANGDSILMRPSGTEPAAKLYVEVADPARMDQLVVVAKELMGTDNAQISESSKDVVVDEETAQVSNLQLSDALARLARARGTDSDARLFQDWLAQRGNPNAKEEGQLLNYTEGLVLIAMQQAKPQGIPADLHIESTAEVSMAAGRLAKKQGSPVQKEIFKFWLRANPGLSDQQIAASLNLTQGQIIIAKQFIQSDAAMAGKNGIAKRTLQELGNELLEIRRIKLHLNRLLALEDYVLDLSSVRTTSQGRVVNIPIADASKDVSHKKLYDLLTQDYQVKIITEADGTRFLRLDREGFTARFVINLELGKISLAENDLTEAYSEVVEQARVEQERQADPALLANPGGIDMNTANMKTNVSGAKIDINFDKAMIEQFKRGDFTGVRPVILNVTPIQSILPMLGLAPRREDDVALGV